MMRASGTDTEGASAHSSDATVKGAVPAMKMRRRPCKSASSRPVGSRSEVAALPTPRCTAPTLAFAYATTSRARTIVSAASSIMSSCPPTSRCRPSSTRMSRAGIPYFASARFANSRNDE